MVRHPDRVTGLPSANDSDHELLRYNALGQRTAYRDRNGTQHEYTYDVLGRPTADYLTALGAFVDGLVLRRQTDYDTAGRPFLFTSYSVVTNPTDDDIVNQVQRDYNGLGQLKVEYQSHAGKVDTTPTGTPRVTYAYSEMPGGANHSRLLSMTYPNTRVLSYNYGTPGSLDNQISRLTSLSEPGVALEGFTFLGLGTVVERAHAQPSVTLTYLEQAGDPAPPPAVDPGDPYKGLDRFGRVRDQRWRIGHLLHTDRFQYGHDRNGNRLYRENLMDATFRESQMDPKPFVRLATRRAVTRIDLPADLAEFYSRHEGVGLESSPDLTLRLCRLEEVARIGSKDLRSFVVGGVPEGWETFAAFEVGMGMFFEEVVYVLDAPCCPPGSILAIGGLASGPGGSGPNALESSLVLAASFRDWLTQLERWGWVEYAVAGIGGLPEQQQQELRRYYLALNPDMNLGGPK